MASRPVSATDWDLLDGPVSPVLEEVYGSSVPINLRDTEVRVAGDPGRGLAEEAPDLLG
jgi:hypothetical protein